MMIPFTSNGVLIVTVTGGSGEPFGPVANPGGGRSLGSRRETRLLRQVRFPVQESHLQAIRADL